MNPVTLHAPRFVLGDLLLTRLHRHRVTLALVTAGAAVIGLAAQIAVPVPGSPVPVTGQTLAVLLVGAGLGSWRAAAAGAAYVLAGLAGLPWLAGGTAGFPGASFGYLLGMVLAGAVVGGLVRRDAGRAPWRAVPTMLLGTATVYLPGVTWLAVSLHLGAAAALRAGVLPFLPGDILKVVLAAGVLSAARRLRVPAGAA